MHVVRLARPDGRDTGTGASAARKIRRASFCGGIIKSATISFGENLVPEDLERAQDAATRADVFLALGTSLGVYPAAALPEIAVRNGARLIIVNAEETPFDQVADAVVREQLARALPAMVAKV